MNRNSSATKESVLLCKAIVPHSGESLDYSFFKELSHYHCSDYNITHNLELEYLDHQFPLTLKSQCRAQKILQEMRPCGVVSVLLFQIASSAICDLNSFDAELTMNCNRVLEARPSDWSDRLCEYWILRSTAREP
eukprot:Gregarina_sp_Poly_1__10737@NODE_817_length_6176_cov_6_331478_g592_i0_p3_GENE_NODE_817_length_6176_cov_6_331478_g592_i0NODE_817_length_6176_cov_6_331478_g592_i0_p3_ORF_typecomplete_len135_score9_17Lys/PF00062_20/4_1Lys/PF00062_20/2_4DUF3579/PF12112_8/0_17_NODE_817_length_6176_cov_6_331478_g592_i046115015